MQSEADWFICIFFKIIFQHLSDCIQLNMY